ncbi:MAG TPA: hypothetical protein VNO54_24640 [Streptosporangiaceae bacterium]|nr:hypothetical protein [Streptosporangiaceae bacterium]
MKPARLFTGAGALLVAAASIAAAGPAASAARAAPTAGHVTINCEYSSLCAEVANPKEVFGSEYVGHDEPSTVFYSNKPGSGNRNQYEVVLPHDPSPDNPLAGGKSYHFELNGALWFGMALCDTQSYPEQVSGCTPDSDRNIVDPAVSPNHPGTAFMELQFYPPGWVPWPTWSVAVGASTCDPTKWCAALNIFSLLEDPVKGTTQNATCAAKVGLEPFNFAFVTKNGRSQAPANPVDSTLTTYTPDPAKDLFMSSGDRIRVTTHDTANGVQVVLGDLSTGQSGSMTASGANGYAQIKYDATGTSCQAVPYNFHPMYSTSSPQTRVIWAAHTYNVAFSDEIGHFEFCNGPNPVPASPFGVDAQGNPIACPAGNVEGRGTDTETTDGDDNFCFPGSEALLVHVNGCTDTNTGFDGVSYQRVWPDGNTAVHPQPWLFSSPLTGPNYNVNYTRMAFEADLPRIEASDLGGPCNRTTGAGCTLIPVTDDGQPAAFYPFFSTLHGNGHGHGCLWAFGNDLPGGNDLGRNAQYGSLLSSSYLIFGGGGAAHNLINNFRSIISNPCRA